MLELWRWVGSGAGWGRVGCGVGGWVGGVWGVGGTCAYGRAQPPSPLTTSSTPAPPAPSQTPPPPFFHTRAQGLVIAGISSYLTWMTGQPVYDAVGSIAVGVLMGAIATLLIRNNKRFLIGGCGGGGRAAGMGRGGERDAWDIQLFFNLFFELFFNLLSSKCAGARARPPPPLSRHPPHHSPHPQAGL
jgi:hypothetical protein